MVFGGILTKIKLKNLQNCQKPVFTVELPSMVKQGLRLCLPLTEYCREEFEKFTTFLTGFLLRSLHFGSNRLSKLFD